MIFKRHVNITYKYGNRHFWCRGYYVDTVGKNAKKIEMYIRNRLRENLEQVRDHSAEGELFRASLEASWGQWLIAAE